MLIIGLCGKAGSGKDTVADRLTDKWGFTRVAFADILKRSIGRDIFGLSRNQLWGNDKEVIDGRYGASPRKILQLAGESMRSIWPDIWVEALLRQMEPDGMYVISDVRYPNEARAITGGGRGMLWSIERDGAGAVNGVPDHSSETSLDGFTSYNFVAYNNGTMEELFEKVDVKAADVVLIKG